jgi:tRNA (guanine10-N2)-dimethyltransferase
MQLAFELSGEHETLPKSEVLACLRALNIQYAEKTFSDGILVIDAQLSPGGKTINVLSKRLGMTHYIYEIRSESKPKPEKAEDILALIKNADIHGIMKQERTFAVRVRVKQKDTPSLFLSKGKRPLPSKRDLERKAGEIIKRKGYEVDLTNPAKTFVLLFAKNTCLLCLLVHSTDKKQFGGRRPHLRPFFLPGVITPKIARALVNLSEIKEGGGVLLDPFCGTGGILIEAGLIGGATTLVGIDVQKKMARGAEANLRFYGRDANLVVGDASKMALRDDSVDAIVTDPPYGRSSLVSGVGYFTAESRSLFRESLYRNALAEFHRVLKKRGKVVVISNSDSIYSLSREYGFRILDRYKYRVHKSLSRYIAVLEKQ